MPPKSAPREQKRFLDNIRQRMGESEESAAEPGFISTKPFAAKSKSTTRSDPKLPEEGVHGSLVCDAYRASDDTDPDFYRKYPGFS